MLAFPAAASSRQSRRAAGGPQPAPECCEQWANTARVLGWILEVFGGVALCFVMTAMVLGTAAPGGAVPTKGETSVLTCGDASVTIQTTPGGGVVAWGTDGAMYHLKTFEMRIYRAKFTTEPTDQDPLFEISQSYGNRNGQGAAMACTTRGYNPDHDATAFEYITVTTIKG